MTRTIVSMIAYRFFSNTDLSLFLASSADGLSTSLQLVSLTDNTLTSGGQDVPNNLTHTLIGPRIQPLANNKVVQTFNSQPAASLIQSKY